MKERESKETERDSGANLLNFEHGKDEGSCVRTQQGRRCESGFYVAVSLKRKFRILHDLGLCYMLPGLDLQQYLYLGTSMPSREHFEQMCERCAKRRCYSS